MRSRIEELRIRAHVLLKDLRSGDPTRASDAATRLARHPRFRDRTLAPSRVRLKTALDVVARESGKPSWADLKRDHEARAETDRFYPRASGSLNHWFRTWEEARAQLEREGGYLLPYRHQFFVCGPAHVASLGLDPDDADWRRIEFDAARPADAEAWERLRAQLGDRPLV